LVPDAGEVVLDQLMIEEQSRLVMVLRAAGVGSICPECQQASRRTHSRYLRRLNDLPWEGIPVRIELRVRRFFCERDDCGHHIFVERLPKTVQRYARRTCRLRKVLEQIMQALGGSAGSRLAEQLGILASGPTLLECTRSASGVPPISRLARGRGNRSYCHARIYPRRALAHSSRLIRGIRGLGALESLQRLQSAVTPAC